MGAISKYFEVEAVSAKEAYNKIIKEEKDDYGTGYHSGSAYNCEFGCCHLKFDKHSEVNEMKIEKHINEIGGGEKCRLDYCDAGITGYIVTTVKKTVVKHGTPKSVYKVFLKNDEGALVLLNKFDDKLQAIDYAERYALGHPNRNSIVIRRRVEYSNGENDDLYRFSTTTSKVDKSYKAKKGQSLTSLHKYIFFGWAPC